MFIVNKYLMTGLLVLLGEIVLIAPSFAQDSPDPPLSHDTGTVSPNQSMVDNDVPSDTVNGILNTGTGVFTVEGLGGVGNDVTFSPDLIQLIEEMMDFSLNPDSSVEITICLADPCVPSGEGTKAISLNDLAKLMEDDLQSSLGDLVATETLQRRATEQPRQFVRRKPDNCVNPAIQARTELENKLAQSRKFLEQVEKLNPDNNIW